MGSWYVGAGICRAVTVSTHRCECSSIVGAKKRLYHSSSLACGAMRAEICWGCRIDVISVSLQRYPNACYTIGRYLCDKASRDEAHMARATPSSPQRDH